MKMGDWEYDSWVRLLFIHTRTNKVCGKIVEFKWVKIGLKMVEIFKDFN